MVRSSLDHVDAVVEGGGCVISGERSFIVSLVQEAVNSGKSATFYVTKPQFEAIMKSYWTPETKKLLKVEEVPLEELQRIESELGIKNPRFVHTNRIKCEKCGSVYGAFEFLQQGISEHGREIVEAALNLANTAVVRVNPSTVPICQSCGDILLIVGERPGVSGTVSGPGFYYETTQYGCCMKV
jgi:ribosomal protein S27E